MLSEDQIGRVIEAYRLQMARYEAAARFVEQRLRREYRAAALPVLLSSRAKHPEDLRDPDHPVIGTGHASVPRPASRARSVMLTVWPPLRNV